MDPITQQTALATAGAAGAEPLYVDDVFSSYLYLGSSGPQTITNGIDLAGEGGLVWIKNRDNSYSHVLQDTERGVMEVLYSNNDNASPSTISGTYDIYQFNNNGFNLGYSFNGNVNDNNHKAISWTFRKAPGFFDVVTYTGTGSARTIAHNLGSVPGCIFVKRTDSTGNWQVYHRGLTSAAYKINLDTASGESVLDNWNSTAPTSSVFSLGTAGGVNASGGTYVAYIFAHDDQSFGTDSDEAIIKCGSFTGNGASGGQEVNIGFEPQWVLMKATSSTTVNAWQIYDQSMGIYGKAPSGTVNSEVILANSPTPEAQNYQFGLYKDGFVAIDSHVNNSGIEYIYIAIRAPNKPPETPTDAFNLYTYTGNGSSKSLTAIDRAPDLVMIQPRNTSGGPQYVDKVRGKFRMNLGAYASEPEYGNYTNGVKEFHENGQIKIGSDSTMNGSGTDYFAFSLKRLPGLFDIVTYTGNGSNRTIGHSLGVPPEFIVVKRRDGAGNWTVGSSTFTNWSHYTYLNDNIQTYSQNAVWNGTAPTSSVFSLGTNTDVNGNTYDYFAYLFASLPGISKIGTYNGTGNDINVDCGFDAGARFVVVKQINTGSSGNWLFFDTERGINTGSEPYLILNGTSGEQNANHDYIDPYTGGFTITSSAPGQMNTSGGTYMFLAFA